MSQLWLRQDCRIIIIIIIIIINVFFCCTTANCTIPEATSPQVHEPLKIQGGCHRPSLEHTTADQLITGVSTENCKFMFMVAMQLVVSSTCQWLANTWLLAMQVDNMSRFSRLLCTEGQYCRRFRCALGALKCKNLAHDRFQVLHNQPSQQLWRQQLCVAKIWQSLLLAVITASRKQQKCQLTHDSASSSSPSIHGQLTPHSLYVDNCTSLIETRACFKFGQPLYV